MADMYLICLCNLRSHTDRDSNKVKEVFGVLVFSAHSNDIELSAKRDRGTHYLVAQDCWIPSTQSLKIM